MAVIPAIIPNLAPDDGDFVIQGVILGIESKLAEFRVQMFGTFSA
jgi:hypothetical protein